eukprot:Colp12_sorted_trinity150504_noHs@28523
MADQPTTDVAMAEAPAADAAQAPTPAQAIRQQHEEFGVTEAVQAAVTEEKKKVPMQSLPIRQYLDQTVVDVLLEGLHHLVKERPPKPIEYLALFLMKHKEPDA